MTDQRILMTDPIPLCWAEPSELAWHPASESDPKGFLTLKGELVIEPPLHRPPLRGAPCPADHRRQNSECRLSLGSSFRRQILSSVSHP